MITLIHGEMGVGKTLVAEAMAKLLNSASTIDNAVIVEMDAPGWFGLMAKWLSIVSGEGGTIILVTRYRDNAIRLLNERISPNVVIHQEIHVRRLR